MSFTGEIRADKPLAYWRFNDVVEQLPAVRRNLAVNPSIEVDASGWSTVDAAGKPAGFYGLSRLTSPSPQQGSAFLRATATANYDQYCWIWSPNVYPVVGRGYTFSTWVRPSRVSTMTLFVDYYDTSGRFFMNSAGFRQAAEYGTVTAQPGVWTRIARTVTPPENTYRMFMSLGNSRVFSGDTIDVDGLLIEEGGVLGSYFDGSTPAVTAPDTRVWDGTSGKSSSTLTTYTARRQLLEVNNSYPGSFTSTATVQQTGRAADAGNKAMRFTGSGSRAEVPGSSGSWDLGLTSSDRWSIEMLVRFDGSGSETVMYTDRWKIAAFGTAVGFDAIGAGSSTNTCPNGRADTAWHHLVATFDGVSLRWYRDGALASTINSPASLNGTSSGILRFGNAAVTLDEVAVYNAPLSTARVYAHYVQLDDSETKYPTALNVTPSAADMVITTEVPNPTQQLSLEVVYSDGSRTVPAPANVTWSSSAPGVATVSSSGLLRAVEAGMAGVSVSVTGLPVRGLAGVSVRRVFAAAASVAPDIFGLDPTFPVYDDAGRFVATTGEYWEVDPGRFARGQWVYDSPFVLNTMAWNISTVAGREGIPVADGENTRVGTRAGREWVPKSPDERTLSLAMWVQGSDTEGNPPKELALRTQFWEHYNKLKTLFAVYDRQILVRRRVPGRFGITLQEAFVEPGSNMDISPTGPMRGAFTIDLKMADPFWYATTTKDSGPVAVRGATGSRRYPRTYPLTYGSAGDSGIFELDNDGTHDAKLWAHFRGPLTNPAVVNLETGERFRLTPDVPVDSNTTVSVDFHEKVITLNGTGSRYWWLDRSSDWLVARPGKQTFQFTHDGGERTGFVSWQWRPSYL